MKNFLLWVSLAILGTHSLQAQKFYTKNGTIGFDATSSSSPEKIEGMNRSAVCVMDTKSGTIQFSVLMKGFAFERALMEEHFNENYVESHKFPKAEFKGKIKDIEGIDFNKEGNQAVKVKGDLTMHGQTKEVETSGIVQIQNKKLSIKADFTLKLEDFEITIPRLVADKVSKTAKISVSCSLELFNN